MHACLRLYIALWLAVATAGAAIAQPPAPHQPLQTFRISGKMVDARSGQALRGCVVQINPPTQRSNAASMVTGEDGTFAFAGLRSGKYALTAARRGYLAQSYQEHNEFSTAIAVGPELLSEGLTFQLTPQAIITGTVLDEAGEPVRNAQVTLYEDQDRDGVRSTRTHGAVATDDRGVYEIGNVSQGTFYLAVSAQPWYAYRTPHTDEAQPDADALDVAYPTAFYSNVTDWEDATPIPVKGGERIEINLTMTPQHAMRLHVSAPGSNHNGYVITLQKSIFGQLEQVPTGNMEPTADGMIIDGVLPGHYEVMVAKVIQEEMTFSSTDGPAGATHFNADVGSGTSRATHFTADVANGATSLTTENEEPEVTVTGSVVVDKVLPDAAIGLQNRKTMHSYNGRLDRAGAFTMNVPPGEYDVAGFIPQHYLVTIVSPNAQIKGRTLSVKAGSSPRLEIVAGTGFAHVDGVAKLAGRGTGNVMIVLAPEDAENNRVRFRRDQSDSDGTFTLFGIIPGRYRLYAIQDGWELEWADPKVLAAYRQKSLAVNIQASDSLRLQVEVQPR